MANFILGALASLFASLVLYLVQRSWRGAAGIRRGTSVGRGLAGRGVVQVRLSRSDYIGSLESRLARATNSIEMAALNYRSTMPESLGNFIVSFLAADPARTFTVAVSDPRSKEPAMSVMSASAIYHDDDLELRRARVLGTLKIFSAIRQRMPAEAIPQFRIGLHQSAMGSYILLDAATPNALAQVEAYTYKAAAENYFGFELRPGGDLFGQVVASIRAIYRDADFVTDDEISEILGASSSS